MKTLITIFTIALSLNVITAKAQIPNCGFENLNADNTISNWGNIYLFAIIIDSNGVSHPDSIVFDNQFYAPTNDSHSGSWAMEMRNAYDFTANEGIAGSVSADTDSVFMGWSSFQMIEVQSPPTNMSFYYKYFPVNNDSAVARLLVLDSWANQIGEAIIVVSGTVSNYTSATTPVVYSAPGVAAYVVMNFNNFYTSMPGVNQPGLGTRFLVDDLSINWTTGINEVSTNDGMFNIYPNPASNQLNIKTNYNKEIHYNIYNMYGQLVLQSNLQPSDAIIPLDKLINGPYNIELITGNKSERHSFVVSK
ncbi:MAG: T9SS type A sorting domain-containing protein [Bacteroidia bacterium]